MRPRLTKLSVSRKCVGVHIVMPTLHVHGILFPLNRNMFKEAQGQCLSTRMIALHEHHQCYSAAALGGCQEVCQSRSACIASSQEGTLLPKLIWKQACVQRKCMSHKPQNRTDKQVSILPVLHTASQREDASALLSTYQVLERLQGSCLGLLVTQWA